MESRFFLDSPVFSFLNILAKLKALSSFFDLCYYDDLGDICDF